MIKYNEKMLIKLELHKIEYAESINTGYPCYSCDANMSRYKIVGEYYTVAVIRHVCTNCYQELHYKKIKLPTIKDTNKKTSRGDPLQLISFAPGAACLNNVAVFRAAKAVWDNRGHFKTRDEFIAEQTKRRAERDRNNVSARHYRDRH